jgi:hypothetical protein
VIVVAMVWAMGDAWAWRYNRFGKKLTAEQGGRLTLEKGDDAKKFGGRSKSYRGHPEPAVSKTGRLAQFLS